MAKELPKTTPSASAAVSGDSPFHRGELAIQERLGIVEKMDKYGRAAIRDFLLDQHREFFPKLPFFVVGSVDARGRPWASQLDGEPGFLHSSDPKRLHIAAIPSDGDPLKGALREGASIGGLGIELYTRRRNRINGKVLLDEDGSGFTIKVDQSFGNCPQYIQARKPRFVRELSGQTRPRSLRGFERFDDDIRTVIRRADTFFIASRFEGDETTARNGVDVSHRGGRPGFLTVKDDRTLLWPDYRGNFFFMTLGNLECDPRCGLLVMDFDRGDTLQLTGTAKVLWDWPKDDPAFKDAHRLVEFTLSEGIQAKGVLPCAWDFLGQAPQFSPG